MPTNEQLVLRNVVEADRLARCPDIKPSRHFEWFTSMQVLKDIDLSEEELWSGIVGDGDDGGMDSLYLLIDDQIIDAVPDTPPARMHPEVRLIIIQSKLANSFSGNAMSKVNSAVPLMLNLSASINDNSDILNESVREFRDLFVRSYLKIAPKHPRLRIECYLCACADEDHDIPNAQGWRQPILDSCKSKFPDSEHEVFLWGAKSLYSAHSRVQPSTFTLNLVDTPTVTDQGSYVALIPIGQLIKMLRDEASGNVRHYLFDSNVRDYYGKSEINEEISSSVLTLGEVDFWWLNNGLTILVTEITAPGKALVINNPQIVNGLQTSISLLLVAESMSEEVKGSKSVLVKFIKVAEPSQMDQIIKATNRQNPMPPAALKALDPFQRQIEDYFKQHDLFYERRRNYYRIRGIPAAKIVSVESLGQFMMSTKLRRPDSARARPSSLLKDTTRYETVFDPDLPLPQYMVAALIGRRVDQYLAEVEGLSAADRTNARFYVMMFVTDIYCPSTVPGERDISIIDPESLDDDLLTACLQWVLDVLSDTAASQNLPQDRIAKGPLLLTEFLQRELELG